MARHETSEDYGRRRGHGRNPDEAGDYGHREDERRPHQNYGPERNRDDRDRGYADDERRGSEGGRWREERYGRGRDEDIAPGRDRDRGDYGREDRGEDRGQWSSRRDRDDDLGRGGRYGDYGGYRADFGGQRGWQSGSRHDEWEDSRSRQGPGYGQDQSYGRGRGYGGMQGSGERGHRGKGPKNYTRSDDRITEDINENLTHDGDLDASEIDVKVSKGEATLSGTVESRDAKRRAEDCADSVSGIKHVQNNLRVKQSGSSGSDASSSGQTGSQSATEARG